MARVSPLWRRFARRKPPEGDNPDAQPSRTVAAIEESLRLLKESADFFPPLKSVVGGVIYVWDLSKVCAGT